MAEAHQVAVDEAVGLLDAGAVAFPAERDLLVVSGADAASYLQGQLSQDVEGLAVGTDARTLLLQPQGKIDAWLRVHRRESDTFWLDTDPGWGPAAAERLNRFKLRMDVEIVVSTVTVLAVRGPAGSAAIDAASATGELVAVDASWGGIDGFDVVGPGGVEDPNALAAALGVPLGPAELAEVVRVLQGLPAMGSELDGSTIPAAAGIVDGSVDFTKGCYVGQELVARIDSRGSNTPTRLHSLRFEESASSASSAPPPGAELVHDGAVVGRVTSAVSVPGRGAIGLGYLKRSVETPATLSARHAGEGSADLDGEWSVEALSLPSSSLRAG